MKDALFGLLLLASVPACSSEKCDDIACLERVELSATFTAEGDGDWSVKLGSYGSCDVSVVSGRVDSARCSGSVTFSSSPDADRFLIDALPETLAVSYTGVEEGSVTVSPRYEDRKPDCSSGCRVGVSQVDIGSMT